MLSLRQASRKAVDAGEPILVPFGSWEGHQLHIRRSQLTMVAAGPGCGKSALVHYICQTGDGEGNKNPTLYISADSNAGTMRKRTGAIATGYDQTLVEQQLKGDQYQKDMIWREIENDAYHMKWLFPSGTDETMILDNVDGYFTTYGEYPEIIVVDNLKDLYIEGAEGEFNGLEKACVFLHQLAQDTNAAVIVTHHVTGDKETSDEPISISGIRGKVTKTPEVVLTLFRQGNVLNVAPVKNRDGIADTTGTTAYPLYADLGKMSFTDPTAVSYQEGENVVAPQQNAGGRF